MTRFVLPDLGYDYSALEPHISGRLLQLHHDHHHRAYVDGANQAIEQLVQARAKSDFSRIGTLEHALAFNVSGHVLHSIFWQNLSPDGGGRPIGFLAELIDRDFGSFPLFQKQMNQIAMTTMGSGWAALIWDPLMKRLGTTQIHDHQSQVTQGSVPLLVLDAWEHAYYFQYQNEKARFFDAVWHLWNWDDVEARLESARGLDLQLYGAVDGEPRPEFPSHPTH